MDGISRSSGMDNEISHGFSPIEYKTLSWVLGADRKICPRVTVWHPEALTKDAKQ